MPADDSRVVLVRGAGDIATGVIQKLVHAGFDVVACEAERPSAIRWRAALCAAVGRGRWTVEDMTAVQVADWSEASRLWSQARRGALPDAEFVVPVLVDPAVTCLDTHRPLALVDAILAKRNLGTHRRMAPVTVACGPGFTAGQDVDLVVETMRGHDLGRVVREGTAIPNTGVPGLIAGKAQERVVHAPAAGVVEVVREIGDRVVAGEVICRIRPAAPGDRSAPVEIGASLTGVIRGMIPDGYQVPARFKIADIDPRLDMDSCCDTISDKSRAVGGGVLDAVLLGLTRAGLLTMGGTGPGPR